MQQTEQGPPCFSTIPSGLVKTNSLGFTLVCVPFWVLLELEGLLWGLGQPALGLLSWGGPPRGPDGGARGTADKVLGTAPVRLCRTIESCQVKICAKE